MYQLLAAIVLQLAPRRRHNWRDPRGKNWMEEGNCWRPPWTVPCGAATRGVIDYWRTRGKLARIGTRSMLGRICARTWVDQPSKRLGRGESSVFLTATPLLLDAKSAISSGGWSKKLWGSYFTVRVPESWCRLDPDLDSYLGTQVVICVRNCLNSSDRFLYGSGTVPT